MSTPSTSYQTRYTYVPYGHVSKQKASYHEKPDEPYYAPTTKLPSVKRHTGGTPQAFIPSTPIGKTAPNSFPVLHYKPADPPLPHPKPPAKRPGSPWHGTMPKHPPPPTKTTPSTGQPFKLPSIHVGKPPFKPIEEPDSPMEISSPVSEKPARLLTTAKKLLGGDLTKATFKQRNIGDCYLVACFDAMQHHPAASKILDQFAIEEPTETDEGEIGQCVVRFPSGKVAEFGTDEVGKEKLGKKPVDGHRVWQILELAYSKITRSARNKERDNPFENDGRGHSPIIMESGIAKNALFDMLGGQQEEVTCQDKSHPDIENTDPFEKNPEGLRKVVTFLRNVERDTDNHYILAASSAAKSDTEDTIELVSQHSGKPFNQSFPRSHAFSIRSFNLDAPQTITIANPHDTSSKVHTLTLSEFCKIFWRISGIKIPAK